MHLGSSDGSADRRHGSLPEPPPAQTDGGRRVIADLRTAL